MPASTQFSISGGDDLGNIGLPVEHKQLRKHGAEEELTQNSPVVCENLRNDNTEDTSKEIKIKEEYGENEKEPDEYIYSELIVKPNQKQNYNRKGPLEYSPACVREKIKKLASQKLNIYFDKNIDDPSRDIIKKNLQEFLDMEVKNQDDKSKSMIIKRKANGNIYPALDGQNEAVANCLIHKFDIIGEFKGTVRQEETKKKIVVRKLVTKTLPQTPVRQSPRMQSIESSDRSREALRKRIVKILEKTHVPEKDVRFRFLKENEAPYTFQLLDTKFYITGFLLCSRLGLINDCSREDKNGQKRLDLKNMIFINAMYNNEIRIFGVAIDEIEKEAVIWGTYGEMYWPLQKQPEKIDDRDALYLIILD